LVAWFKLSALDNNWVCRLFCKSVHFLLVLIVFEEKVGELFDVSFKHAIDVASEGSPFNAIPNLFLLSFAVCYMIHYLSSINISSVRQS
jgi:hypothetical protein